MAERDIQLEIKKICNDNQILDLKRFYEKRKTLNLCNVIYAYSFHIVQSLSMLTIAIATAYDLKPLSFLGLGLQLLATLIIGHEKINNNMLKILLDDIKNIKDGNYVDEGQLIDPTIFDKQTYNSTGSAPSRISSLGGVTSPKIPRVVSIQGYSEGYRNDNISGYKSSNEMVLSPEHQAQMVTLLNNKEKEEKKNDD